MYSNERIHSLDSLRAIMMILGIVLHSAETYNVGTDYIWAKDPQSTHLFFNYLNSTIHIFRMPIFFLIAGFFGSLLYYKKGPLSMIKNRVSRIVVPFVTFLLLLNPLILLSVNFTTEAFNTAISAYSTTMSWFPEITYHLWFLYYLILITFICFVLADLVKRSRSFTKNITKVFEWLIHHRVITILLFSIVIFIMLVWMWDLWAPTPLSFAVDFKVFLFYLFFYLIGWVLFKSKHLLDYFMQHDWLYVTLGFLIFTTKFVFRDSISDVLYGGLNAVVVWFFVFGIMGLFVRYGSMHSSKMRYISDSSYWVYLVHLPLTLFIPGVIVELAIPVFAKFLIVVVLTTTVCFVSYHFLVRGTLIGKLLNGRKYTIKNERF